MNNKISIRVYKIFKNAFKLIEGRMCQNDNETHQFFNDLKRHSINSFCEGDYCFDLFNEEDKQILDTITISKFNYEEVFK